MRILEVIHSGEGVVEAARRGSIHEANGAGVVEEPFNRSGEDSRAFGGVTSECRIELKSVLACSARGEVQPSSVRGMDAKWRHTS